MVFQFYPPFQLELVPAQLMNALAVIPKDVSHRSLYTIYEESCKILRDPNPA